MTARPALSQVMLWLHDRVCMGYNSPNRYCDGDGRRDHAKTQRQNAAALMAATTRPELARLLHHQWCPAWLERSNGAYYVARSDAWCGTDGQRHVAAIERSNVLAELAQLAGVP